MAFDYQRAIAGLHLFRLREELAAPLTLEEVELAGESADDQVKVTVAVPVDRERPGADIVDPVLALAGLAADGDDEWLAVGALEDFRLAERPVCLAVQDLEQPRHVSLAMRE